MEVVMPQLGETVKEGTVTAWHKQVGEQVQEGEPLFEVTTDKVDTEIPAPVSGVLKEIAVPPGQKVSVGTRLAIIEEAKLAQGIEVAAPAPRHREGKPLLSPVVRALLAEHQLDSAEIPGTGAEGRITRNDVLAYLGRRKAVGDSRGEGKRLPLSRIRKRTAEQMALSWKNIPHVLQAVEVDFQAVDLLRQAQHRVWKTREGWSLTYLPFVARAVCEAVADFPAVNATFEADSLILHPRINLGIAVDLGPEGLIVPVVKDADQKSLPELARAIHSLVEKARAHQLAPDELTEGTYTLSNSGSFGTLLTAPIINPPQVAILSIDGVVRKPLVVEGTYGEKVVIRPIGVLAQSFDHRAFDGAYSAAYLRRLKEILQAADWSAALESTSGSPTRER
jgi:2-oxoglutarate dehydrogenase E2 component (dihydrolipoamide succinyltransferase)